MSARPKGGVVRIELRRDAGRVGPALGPWIRRNQIARMLGVPDPHVLAQIFDRKGDPLAWGLVSPVSTITVRVLGWGAEPPPDDWLDRRLAAAFAAREAYAFERAGTTGYRLVNSEGDGLPGLVIDRYGDDLVVQLGTSPMAAREPEVLAWLRARGHDGIHVTVPEGAARAEGIEASAKDGAGGVLSFLEHHLRYEVAGPPAQKTGAYFDQRANRRTIAQLAKRHGGALLDLGCHAGGFALCARKAGVEVVALDRSRTVLAHARENEAANGLGGITWIEADMFEPLDHPALQGPFGTIVVDPPKIASKKQDVERAQAALARIVHELAPRLLPGGHLALCSCSHHLDRDDLDRVLVDDARRGWTRVLALGAGVDHPVAPGHREGEYLRVNVYQRRDGNRLVDARVGGAP
jgi:23S rRNA (cytosine1962-C5)-methyltransferase